MRISWRSCTDYDKVGYYTEYLLLPTALLCLISGWPEKSYTEFFHRSSTKSTPLRRIRYNITFGITAFIPNSLQSRQASRMCTYNQCCSQQSISFPWFAGFSLFRAFIVTGTQSRPRWNMGVSGKALHVCANHCNNRLRTGNAETGNILNCIDGLLFIRLLLMSKNLSTSYFGRTFLSEKPVFIIIFSQISF